jgi:hypothetical protein
MGDTMLMCIYLQNNERIPRSQKLWLVKQELLKIVYNRYNQIRGNGKIGKTEPWYVLLHSKFGNKITQESLNKLLFSREDKTDILPSVASNSNVHFTAVDYEPNIMQAVLEMYYKVQIIIIEAGWMYTVGPQGAKAHYEMTRPTSPASGQSQPPRVYMYKHRDVLTPMLPYEDRNSDLNPKYLEICRTDLPAQDVPINAYNTFSILIPVEDHNKLTRMGMHEEDGKLLGALHYKGIDPLEKTRKSQHAFQMHHAHELNVAMRPQDAAHDCDFTITSYGAYTRTPQVTIQELMEGPLMRSLGFQSEDQLMEFMSIYIPNVDEFMSDAHEEKRNLICGRFKNRINKGKPLKVGRCFHQNPFEKVLKSRDE